jgi:signal transduction histidine kinase
MSRIQDGFVAKERFLTNVSHEIKTPIAVLLIEAQTVNREDCSADVRRFMDTVEEEMTRLGKLVESFLTLTRLQSGRGPAMLKRYCVNDLVTDAISSCNTMARQHQVSLQPVLLADEETVDAAVVGDPDLLRTLVENLIRNSIRFSSAGEPVEVIGEVAGDHVHVRVRDTGPGIPPDRLGTIFDRFAQAHNTERQGRGHGLGLAIAKGIAELHGGTVEAHNRPERGCEFIVRLRFAAVPKLAPSAT